MFTKTAEFFAKLALAEAAGQPALHTKSLAGRLGEAAEVSPHAETIPKRKRRSTKLAKNSIRER